MIGRRPELDNLDREMREHIDAETEELIARGMPADDARAAAIRKFGNVTRIKEEVRAVWTPDWLDAMRQDLRDAARQLRRNPALAAVLVPTLALGIGLTTAIFSVVNAVLIRPLSFPHAERMVWLTTAPARENRAEILNSIQGPRVGGSGAIRFFRSARWRRPSPSRSRRGDSTSCCSGSSR